MAMGFSEDKAKKALNKTGRLCSCPNHDCALFDFEFCILGWQGVEQAMDWLLAHQDDLDVEEEQEEEKGTHCFGPRLYRLT